MTSARRRVLYDELRKLPEHLVEAVELALDRWWLPVSEPRSA